MIDGVANNDGVNDKSKQIRLRSNKPTLKKTATLDDQNRVQVYIVFLSVEYLL